MKLNGEDMCLSDLQDAVLTVLKNYWLHKFILHLKSSQSASLGAVDPLMQNASMSDVTALENMQGIDRVLRMAQGKLILQVNKHCSENSPQVKWGGLFLPQVQVDDNFVSKKQDIVTVHDDGQVNIEPTDPVVLDKMLQKYRETPPPPSSTRAFSIGINLCNLKDIHCL